MNVKTLIAVAALTIGSVGCATFDGMSNAEQGTLLGAGAGAVGGAALGGGALGTAAGAAAGGLIGNEVGKRR